MDLLAQIYLVSTEAHCRLCYLEPQAPPLHKPFMPQSKEFDFWGKNSFMSWPCKPPTCMPSYVHPCNLCIGCNYFSCGSHA
jgi:hypothetical protein